jgi:hypothetical protein
MVDQIESENMDRLSLFVKNTILAFPHTFPTRMDVLLYSYFVAGNVLIWKDGELVSKSPSIEEQEAYKTNKVVRKELSLDFINGIKGRLKGSMKNEDLEIWYEVAVSEEKLKYKIKQDQYDYIDSNIDAIASTHEDKITSMPMHQYYERPDLILNGLFSVFPITIAKMPQRVESSFFDGAIEILDLVILNTLTEDHRTALLDYRATLFAVHERY